MIIDELLIALGVKADTKPLADTQKGLEGVESQSKKTDSAMSKFSTTLSNGIKKFATFATIAFTAIKTTMMGAWAYLDSTINRVEELQNSQDASLKTTKEQVEMAKKYRENMDKMGKTIENVKTRIALAFLPAMYEMSKQYGKLLDDNKDLIENGIKKLLAIATKASQVLTNFFKFINLVITGTVGWKNALLILVGVLAWVKRAMILAFITNPIFWVMAAIAGLLLLIDDFMTYLNGGESELGEFWGSMLGWVNDNKDALLALKDMFMNVLNFIAGAVALVVGLFTGNTYLMQAAWEGMVESLKAAWSIFSDFAVATGQVIAEAIKNAFTAAKNYVVGILNQIVSAISNFISRVGSVIGIIQGVIIAPFKAAFDWIANKFGELPSMISKATSLMTFGLSDKAASAVSNIRNRITNNTTSVNASINVNGTANPQQTAKAVGANLNSMTKSNVGGAAVA